MVSLIATVTLWSFTIAVLAAEAETADFFSRATLWISTNFTWLYTLTQNAWVFVIMYVLLRKKYANIKLGQPEDRPDYSDIVWFILMFTTSLGTGVFFFGVSEPMYYYRGDSGLLGAGTNFLAKMPFMNDDQRASMALFVTFFHWGIHGWAPYTLVALTLGVVCYRLGRPMTLRSAFYPVIGDYVNGLAGDLIDALSIATTTFGLCTSLGLGAKSINATLHRMSGATLNEDSEIESLIVWGITCITTVAVVLGMRRGIISCALFAFSVLSFLILILFFHDNTWFLLNTFTQTIGVYVQYVFLAGFDNDAFPQLNYEFQHGSTQIWGARNLATSISESLNTTFSDPVEFYDSSPTWFMDSWTVFYWAWWISWAPFVGMFMAKISRGRTIRQVILVGLFAPMLLCFFVLNVLGALGIKMQRVAELALHVQPDWSKGVVNCGDLGYLDNEPVSDAALKLKEVGYYALSCRKSTDRVLDILEPYGALTPLLQVLVLVGIIMFFITSADAGAYVDDIIAANGLENPPVLQKIWWAITQGAAAQALLSASSAGLSTIQAVSICAALPYTFALNFMCTALIRACNAAIEEQAFLSMRKGFSTSIVDIFENFSSADEACTTKVMPSKERWKLLLRNIFYPYTSLYTAGLELYGPSTLVHVCWFGTSLYYLWILLLCLTPLNAGTHTLAWISFIFYAALLTSMRYQVRKKWKIIGNLIEDFVASMLFFPFVLVQLQLEIESHTGRA